MTHANHTVNQSHFVPASSDNIGRRLRPENVIDPSVQGNGVDTCIDASALVRRKLDPSAR
jgi:hypothetical protein